MATITETSKSYDRPFKPGSKGMIEIDHYFFRVDIFLPVSRSYELRTWLAENSDDFHSFYVEQNAIHIYGVCFKTYNAAFACQIRWG